MQGSYLAYNYKKVKFFKTNKLSETGLGIFFFMPFYLLHERISGKKVIQCF